MGIPDKYRYKKTSLFEYYRLDINLSVMELKDNPFVSRGNSQVRQQDI